MVEAQSTRVPVGSSDPCLESEQQRHDLQAVRAACSRAHTPMGGRLSAAFQCIGTALGRATRQWPDWNGFDSERQGAASQWDVVDELDVAVQVARRPVPAPPMVPAAACCMLHVVAWRCVLLQLACVRSRGSRAACVRCAARQAMRVTRQQSVRCAHALKSLRRSPSCPCTLPNALHGAFTSTTVGA